MRAMADQSQDCWLTRVQKMEKLLNTPKLPSLSLTSGKILLADLKLKFEAFWKHTILEQKIGPDGINDKKLRAYSTLKNSFCLSPI